MKHMTWGAVALLGVTTLAGCYSYASDSINNHTYNTLQATPDYQTMKMGDSDQVIFRLVNDANNGARTSYTIDQVGTGIAVHYQPNWRPIICPGTDSLCPQGDKDAQEYFTVGNAIGVYTYRVTPTSVNTGVSRTVTVLVQPKNLQTALSKHTAAVGDTVVITAPAGLVFSQASAVTFASGSQPTVVGVAPDSSSITIVVGAGNNGPATVTLVTQPLATGIGPITLVTGDTLVTTPLPKLVHAIVTASNNFAFGSTMTVQLTGGFKFSSAGGINVGPGLGTAFKVISADSTTATVVVPPGQTDTVAVSNVFLPAYHPAPDSTSRGNFAIKTDVVVTTEGAPPVVPTTLSASSGGVGGTITVTLGGGQLRFTKSSTVVLGGAAIAPKSFSADSLTATLVLPVGTTGPVSFTNLVSIVGPSLVLAAEKSDGKTFTDTTPQLAVVNGQISFDGTPANFVACTGATLTETGSGSKCAFALVTLGGSLNSTITWTGADADLGIILMNSTASSCIGVLADNNGVTSGATGDTFSKQWDCGYAGPEGNLASGTYVVVVVMFSETSVLPTTFHAHITEQ